MINSSQADWIHVDVMDGQFVPNLTFGAKVIETLRRLTKLPLDVHLMVEQPEKYFDDFAAAGAHAGVHGIVSFRGDRTEAEMRLYDLTSPEHRLIATRKFEMPATQWRRPQGETAVDAIAFDLADLAHHVGTLDQQTDDRVGLREAQPDADDREDHRQRGEPIRPSMVAFGDQRGRADPTPGANARDGHQLVARTPDQPGGHRQNSAPERLCRVALSRLPQRPGAHDPRRHRARPRGRRIIQRDRLPALPLPDPPLPQRRYDPRTGNSAETVEDYSQPFDGEFRLRSVSRWRLVPSDPEAYRRGELVEPVDGLTAAQVAAQASERNLPIERTVTATIDGQRRSLRVSDFPLGNSAGRPFDDGGNRTSERT